MRKAQAITPLLLILVLALSLGVRLSYYSLWDKNPDRNTFSDDIPLLINMDGYFYLRMAEQIQQGTYDTLDEKSVYPQGASRRSVPPLLSSITAWTSSTFSMRLEDAALLIPAIIGSLLVFPMFFVGRFYGGNLAGICAALFAAVGPGFVERSSVGFFDTDGGNIFFAATCAAMFMQFGARKSWKRYLWLAGGFVSYGLFLLWWDQTLEAVSAVALLPLVGALIVDYRPRRREAAIFFAALAVVGLAFIFLQGSGFIGASIERATRTLAYVKKETTAFPNPAMFVGEQQRLQLSLISERTMGSMIGMILGFAGLTLLVWKQRLRCHYLSGFIITGVMSFLAARFVIFLIPLLALGIAYLITWLWSRDNEQSIWRLAAIGCFALALLLQMMTIYGFRQVSVASSHPEVTEVMLKLKDLTPDNSVLWANWDIAYPLMLYSDRATIVDGQSRTAERFWINCVPFACATQRQAANWMQFYVAHGEEGLQKAKNDLGGTWAAALPRLLDLLAMGPDAAGESLRQEFNSPEERGAMLAFLFPQDTPPIYLFLDHRSMHTPWYTVGRWDFANKQGFMPTINLFISAMVDEHNLKALAFRFGYLITANLDTGIAMVGGRRHELSKFITLESPDNTIRTYRDEGNVIGYNPMARGGAFSSPQVVDTVIYQLLVGDKNDSSYFSNVYDQPILVQCWQVSGDHYSQQAN
ncbi:STT3 domain-containing protein [Oceanidesulfovibrio marinus]|uniref:Dolichyl-diphosphooligosaccharide--protein glycosyltransferase n=1 Tax=Oceanidesulfovibrio marinus TaxID=370038 RepID=A0ABX6NDE4_9BACT|nr:STT3 domain-containing protein [Oceanidesulfovibrio marinus]QJT08361.1 hypothetical protein E8L03_05200 [Oceanidesulfovibrio marinus]